MVRIPAAGDLLSAKLVFHDFPRPVHPYFIGGVLSEASLIGSESEPNRIFNFKTQYARRILEGMTADLWQEGGVTVRTDAKIHTGAGYKKAAGRRLAKLQLRLTQRPIHRHLFELNSIDAAQVLAAELLQQWKAARPS